MIHLSQWSKTTLGTAIELYASDALSTLQQQRPILLMGGVHGDEPLGVELARKTLEYLQSEEKKPHSQVRVPWVLIPCLNVDGFSKGTRVNGRGVDLNRNYPSKSWQPTFEKERYFPGPNPGSEPEIQAVTKLIHQLKPRLIIHFHSWKPMVVCAGEPGQKDAERLARSSGYKVVPEIGYPTPGSLSEFGWFDHQIPIICTEEDDNTRIEDVWPNFGQGLREILQDPSPR
jgi:protein MpaA